MALLIKKKHWGFQCRKKYAWKIAKKYNYLTFRDDFHYCDSHGFLYDKEVEKKKLYNAQPCYYTDNRYKSSGLAFYKETHIVETRRKYHSVRHFKNILKGIKNVPEGTVAYFESSHYLKGKNVNLEYHAICKYLSFTPEYQINLPGFTAQFEDPWCKEFTEKLRAAGFIVNVYYDDKWVDTDTYEEYQMARAYGFNKMIGFSPKGEVVSGYHNGEGCILYDSYGYFDKWSRCEEISMDTPIENIILMLQSPTDYGN